MTRRATRGWRTVALIAFAVLLTACGGGMARQQRAELDAAYADAERAFSLGDSARAEAGFVALEALGTPEALGLGAYRRAQLRLRANDLRGAAQLFERARSVGTPDRAALAELRLARLDIEALSQEARGRERLRALVEAWPSTGAADRAVKYLALKRTPATERDRGHDWETARWLAEVSQRTTGETVSDNAAFWSAWVRLHRVGDIGGARDALRAFVSAYGGVSALADDGFWLLGAIERRQGRFDAAVATYEAFLALRQTAGSLLGPFRSKRLDDAAYLVGAVHFHDRGDLEAAARAFERLLAEFSTSTWRDDALWALAGVAHLRGDKEGTHAALERLVSEHADSRFAALARAALYVQGPTLARSPGSINTGLLDPRKPGEAL